MMPGTRERTRKQLLSPATIASRRSAPSFNQVKVANCAGCGVEVTSHKYNAGKFGMELLFGRLDDRPYCQACYQEKQVKDNMK